MPGSISIHGTQTFDGGQIRNIGPLTITARAATLGHTIVLVMANGNEIAPNVPSNASAAVIFPVSVSGVTVANRPSLSVGTETAKPGKIGLALDEATVLPFDPNHMPGALDFKLSSPAAAVVVKVQVTFI